MNDESVIKDPETGQITAIKIKVPPYNPELDPDSPEFDPVKYREAVKSAMEQLPEHMEKMRERLDQTFQRISQMWQQYLEAAQAAEDADSDEELREAAKAVKETSRALKDSELNLPIQASESGLLTEKFFPILNGEPVNDIIPFSMRRVEKNQLANTAIFTTKGGHKVTIEEFSHIEGQLSTSAKKILNVATYFLKDANYYRGNRDAITATVEIPLIDYGRANRLHVISQVMETPEEQAKEDKRVAQCIKMLKRDIRRDLRDISRILWSGDVTKGPNKGDYRDIRIISSHAIRQNMVRINFDVEMAAFLVNAYIMWFPMILLHHDNRKPNAYAIGYKIAYHNSNDHNAVIGTDNTLSVKSLLEAAPEIPSYEELQTKGQRNWKRKIKSTLEAALEENVTIGLLRRWEYRNPTTNQRYTPESAKDLTWYQYSHLMVDFSLIDAPPQTARRAARAEEKRLVALKRNQPAKKKGRPHKPKNGEKGNDRDAKG